MSAMFRHLLGSAGDQVPRKSPDALPVFGYNSPSEQKIQMAILDYL